MILQRRAALTILTSLTRAHTLLPRSRHMSSSNPTFSRPDEGEEEEEVVFTGRSAYKRGGNDRDRRGQRAYPREYPGYVSGSGYPRGGPAPMPPAYQSSRVDNRNSTYRDPGGGVGLPLRPRTPEEWGDRYRPGRYREDGDEPRGGQSRARSTARMNEDRFEAREEQEWYRDTGRRNEGGDERQGRYRDVGRRNDGYEVSDYEYRGAGAGQSLRGDFYRHGNNSSNGGVALHGRFDDNGRDVRYHDSLEPYLSHDDRPGRSGPSEHPENDSYRSERRRPPVNSRGPLSSARFSQGIDKHSRYPPPPPPPSTAPSTTTTTTTITTSNPTSKRDRNSTRRAAKREGSAKLTSPPPPQLPFTTTKLPIPTPTSSYLSLTLSPNSHLTSPARQLIILDLNGTLLSREKARFRCGSANPTPRPGLAPFLSYLFANFSTMVWSSARSENVALMVHALFSASQRSQLLAVWARDTLGLTQAQFKVKTQVYKRLERVWEGPHAIVGGWDQTNTVLLDDSREKAVGQPWNHIEVSEFAGGKVERKEDRALYALVGYLEEMRWRGNVSAFIRSTPFSVCSKWDAVGERVLVGYGGGDVGDLRGVERQ